MAASILSQDILAICLVLADGDIDISINELICRVENFQEENNRHFGMLRSDFRTLFYKLITFELEIGTYAYDFNKLKFRDIVKDILNSFSANFNDSDEYWLRENEKWNKLRESSIEYWYNYTKNQYRDKQIIKEKMKSFFNSQSLDEIHPVLVRQFMDEVKISENILFHCSKPGDSN